MDEESVLQNLAFRTFHSSLISEVSCFPPSDARSCLTAVAPVHSPASGALGSALGGERGLEERGPSLGASPDPTARHGSVASGRGGRVLLPISPPPDTRRSCPWKQCFPWHVDTEFSLQGLLYWRLFRCCATPAQTPATVRQDSVAVAGAC